MHQNTVRGNGDPGGQFDMGLGSQMLRRGAIAVVSARGQG